ncbi:hypothetical protein Q3G72_022536 [Acer saccharum]|nr:hypothetical protein Q3G72_022536 [Acer saccharum]
MMMAIRPWKSFLELFIFLYFAYLQLAAAALQYDDYRSAKLSASWTNNDLSAGNITAYGYVEVTMRIILLNVPDPSSRIGFACGFVYNLSTDSSFLATASVRLSSPNNVGEQSYWYIVEVLWLANRNKPVHENATLELHTNGDLILRDADGSFVWSTNTSHMSVAGLQMLNTGNLVLFGDNNKTIWQSFDQPMDTLLPGQKQMAGQKLEIKGFYPQVPSEVTMQIILLKVPNRESEIGFAFGFVYNQSIGSYFLGAASVSLQSLFYTGGQSYSSNVNVYWLANRNKPVHENATLELHTSGDLILTDADGSFVWSTNTSHMSVAGLQMLKTGNLVLFDDSNKTIWQSFDHPTDTLLPGQKHMARQKPEIKGIYPQDPSEVTMQIILLNSITGFAFGFVYNQLIGSNFLGAASVGSQQPFYIGGQSYLSDVEVYWLANRNKLVHENATLQLQENGDLILRDADGSFVWSTNTSHKSVAGLQMLKTGNLVLFDDSNKTIWQSFDHPTDTLLPGQKHMAGQKPEIKGIYPQYPSEVNMQIILLNSITGFAFGFVYNQSIGPNFLGAASVGSQQPFYTGGQSYLSDVEVYWLANRNKLVHENATLQLQENGDLILRDADGSFVWSTNTSHKSVAGLQMLKTGNLVLFDDSNKTIWQSFDHPTDTLLPGQKHMAGQKPEIKGIYPQYPSEVTMQIILLNSITGFAFGFVYNQSIGSNFLGAASVGSQQPFYIGGQSYLSDVEVYWLANRNKLVHENATLQLQENGDLILRDADGSFVWSTNTSHKSVAGLQMLKTGNLVLFDDSNKTIWQSFDHPTDTLLPGQKLMAGQKLVSRASATNWTEGSFYLSVSSEGLFAFYRSTVPQMYFNFSVSGIKESERPSYIRVVNGTLALYILSAEPSVPDAVLSSPVDYAEYTYMRLDSDGHLRLYNGSMDPVDILAGDLEECDYPTVCGHYGLCSDGQCSCPYSFEGYNGVNQSGCTEINPVTCENGQSQYLYPLKDVYYFNYVDPDAADLKGIHMDSCSDACLGNCSCKVAMFWFYYNASHGNCFLLSNVLSLKNGVNKDFNLYGYPSYAFLKLPKEESQRLSSVSAPPTRAIVGVTVGTFALVVLLVGFCILCIRKKKNTDGDVEDYLNELSGMPTRFSYEELKLATEDFQRKLGEGGFGAVFEGTLVSGEKVAAKRLDALGQGKKEFLAEVKTIGSIHHVNLVRLVGFCAENLHRLLVYEFMCNGSLEKWIFNRIKQPALDWQTRKTIILDIAKGLAYLHEECRQRIVHLDIKPQNILLDVNLRAKISDFGLSKLLDRDQSQVVTTMRGTPGYLAPELFSSIVTEKADVYSFGIVVMEVVCGRKNLDRSHSEGCIHLLPFFMIKAEDNCLIDLVDKDSEDMQLHGEEVVQMMRVAAWCLQNDYNRRPSMSTVVKVLEGTMEFEASLTAITRELEEQFGDTTSALLPSILSGPR